MKCDENGGCPMEHGELCSAFGGFLDDEDCHLTPADFPRLNAMIRGEWLCSKCGFVKDPYSCAVGLEPCALWQEREEQA